MGSSCLGVEWLGSFSNDAAFHQLLAARLQLHGLELAAEIRTPSVLLVRRKSMQGGGNAKGERHGSCRDVSAPGAVNEEDEIMEVQG